MTNDVNERIKGYQLSPPSVEKAITSLTGCLGSAEAQIFWDKACAICGVSNQPKTADELEKVFQFISEKTGTVGVVGKSLVVRARTYKILRRNEKN